MRDDTDHEDRFYVQGIMGESRSEIFSVEYIGIRSGCKDRLMFNVDH